MLDTDLYKSAQAILLNNRIKNFTKPAPQLYPYQWNWDSGFIAMAYSHYKLDYAYQELNSLFSAQWQNGLLPQIVFHQKSDDYFPGPDFWQTQKSGMCSHIESSGITMPAVHGFVLLYLLKNSTDLEETKRFLKEIIPKVKSLHRYLYQNRDPKNEGLPYIRHPWEGGTDNSPLYDDCLSRIAIDQMDLPDYKRKDLRFEGSVDHRPLKKDYDRYVYLVDLFRKCKYNEIEIDRRCPFKIQDPLFIGILNYSNQALIEICEYLNMDISEIHEWYELTNDALMSKLWDGNGIFNAFDLSVDERIEKECNSCFIPALSVDFSDQEKRLVMNRYEDKFVKTDAGWKIKHRTLYRDTLD